MATGMVLVIVMRHIDLSVGSIIGFVSTIICVAQVHVLPAYLGLENPAIWIIAVVLALAIGAAIGAFHGSLVAYLGIPAFIVTLGGAICSVARRRVVGDDRPDHLAAHDRFALIGGGPQGSIGALWSWVLDALLACVAIVFGLYAGRQRRARFRFPAAADVGGIYDRRRRLFGCRRRDRRHERLSLARARRRALAEDHHIPVPEGGLFISTGYAIRR